MPTQRQLRVNNLLQQEIASILRREITDPHVGFVTITGVEVSVDLRHARVFVSVLGDETAKKESMAAVIRARNFIRGLLGDRLDLRYIPELRFQLDETAEKAQQMEILLNKVAENLEDEEEGAVG
jgi:ribosome-binding factor A